MATTVTARKAAPGKALQASPKANGVAAAPAAPLYWEEARTALMKKDRVLRRLIPKYPGLTMTSRGDPFTTLARSIVGQQISVKAAQSVWERMIQAVPDFTPEALWSGLQLHGSGQAPGLRLGPDGLRVTVI